jgi:hypothetical protein
MKRTLALWPLLFVLAGCAQAPSTQAKADAPAAASDVRTASAPAGGTPQSVVAITDQHVIYVCPRCAMEFDRAGQCGMCHVDLEPVRIDYLCPADGKPVERAGRCPRCEADAKIVRTAMAVNLPSALSGN